MIRRLFRSMLLLLGLTICACSSTPGGGSDAMSYRQAVRQIGRQPTRMSRGPDGATTATWETEVPGGVRLLIMKFGPDDRLVNSTTRTVPRSGSRL